MVTTRAGVARLARRVASSGVGRIILGTVGLKMVAAVLGAAAPGWLRLLDSAGTIVVAVVLGYLLLRSFGSLQRRLLWRVSRKLVLSYILIGFVPFLLTILFFLLSGALLVYTASSSLVQRSLEDVVDDAVTLATSTAADLTDVREPALIRAVLARRALAVANRYPGASIAVLTADRRAGPRPRRRSGAPARGRTQAGRPRFQTGCARPGRGS